MLYSIETPDLGVFSRLFVFFSYCVHMTHTIHGIALDLETTGLNPHEDTIIEIAAVRFTLKYQENQWTLQDVTERSMLINPGFPLSEEVSLITGITDNILSGCATWQEIRSKVADFFSDAPMIVGHNVFFDIDMLKTHDIDLSHLPIIDTFELAQILSPEAKSLNLGFL